MKFLRRLAHVFAIVAVFPGLSCSQTSAEKTRMVERPDPAAIANEADEHAAYGQRGTETAPFVFKTQKSEKETANEEAEEQQKVTDRKWVRGQIIATGVLSVLTPGALIIQVLILLRQNKMKVFDYQQWLHASLF